MALLLCLASVPVLAEDEATELKLVEYILKTPTSEANPALVAPFMRLDTAKLPKKLRDKAKAKQLEIEGAVKIFKGKKKGPFRYPEACVIKRYEGSEGIRIMGLIIGNVEIETEEEEYIEKKANCTEDQLLCEFSLNIVLIKRKDKPPLKRYYLLDTDPLMAFVAEKRGGGASNGNRYFQELKPSCQQLAKP